MAFFLVSARFTSGLLYAFFLVHGGGAMVKLSDDIEQDALWLVARAKERNAVNEDISVAVAQISSVLPGDSKRIIERALEILAEEKKK